MMRDDLAAMMSLSPAAYFAALQARKAAEAKRAAAEQPDYSDDDIL